MCLASPLTGSGRDQPEVLSVLWAMGGKVRSWEAATARTRLVRGGLVDSLRPLRLPGPVLSGLGVISAVLGYWLALGITFYGKAVPFYDSLGYQRQYLEILSAYRRGGAADAFELANQQGPQTRLYPLIEAVFAPALPESIAGLYLLGYGLVLLSFAVIAWAAFRISGRASAALAVCFALLAMAIFGRLNGGPLDQRLDLTAALLLDAAVFALLVLARPGAAVVDWWVMGALGGLVLLFRPVSVSQLALVAGVLLVVQFPSVSANARCGSWPAWTGLIVPPGVAFALLLPRLHVTYDYYVHHNADVGRFSAMTDSLEFALQGVESQAGGLAAVLAAAALVWLARRGEWRNGLVCIGVMATGIVPFVLTRSGGNSFVLLGPALLLIVPMTYAAASIPRPGVVALAFIAGIASLYNLGQLGRAVSDFDASPRVTLASVLGRITAEDGPTNVSGIDPVVDSLVGMDEIAAAGKLRYGKRFFHVTDFGLPASALNNSASLGVARSEMSEFCSISGVIIVPSNSQRNDPGAYLFVYRYAEELGSEIRSLPCIGTRITDFNYLGRAFDVYRLRP